MNKLFVPPWHACMIRHNTKVYITSRRLWHSPIWGDKYVLVLRNLVDWYEGHVPRRHHTLVCATNKINNKIFHIILYMNYMMLYHWCSSRITNRPSIFYYTVTIRDIPQPYMITFSCRTIRSTKNSKIGP